MDTPEKIIFYSRSFNRRLFNTTLLRRRSFDGHIVSLHQAGFHWLKNMLSYILVKHYNLPPMSDIRDNRIIGHPKSPPIYDHIPAIVHSHSHPHLLTLRIPCIHYPNYLVLVRDLRTSLISHYERFKKRYHNISFTEYLHGDIHQKKFFSDIYSRIQFMNEWGGLLDSEDRRIMALRYEDLQEDTYTNMRNVSTFFGITNVPDSLVHEAINENTREKMAQRQHPEKNTFIVRSGPALPVVHYFDEDNQAFLVKTCDEFLKHNFGYNYTC